MGVDLPDYVLQNRAHWDKQAPGYVPSGERHWAEATPTWGIWSVPESTDRRSPSNSFCDRSRNHLSTWVATMPYVTKAVIGSEALYCDANDAKWGVGTWTLTLAGRRWTLRQEHGLYGNAIDRGTIDAKGGFTTALVDGYGHHEFLGVLRGRRTSTGVAFTRVASARNTDLAAVLSARPWRRLA